MTTEISAQEGDALSSAMVGVVAQGNIQSTFTVTVSTSDGTAVGKCRIYYLCIVTTVTSEVQNQTAVDKMLCVSINNVWSHLVQIMASQFVG